jgi:signal transduction histidine kinase
MTPAGGRAPGGAIGTWAKVAFVTVVMHGVAQYLAEGLPTFGPLRTALVLALAIAYVAFACSDRLREGLPATPLMVVQNALGFALPWVSGGNAVMAPLAVISFNGFFLPAAWVIGLGVLHTASALLVCKLLVLGTLGEQVAYIFVVAAVFVAAFTKAVVSEMRLRAQLDAASKALAQQAAQAETLATHAERERIARELHDSLGHALVAAHVHTRVAERDLTARPERARQALASAREAVQSGLDDLRATVRTLSAPAGEPLDLGAAIQRLVDGHQGADPEMTLDIRREPEPAVVPSHVALALLRVAQEALTNAIKHARAKHVRVELALQPARVRLTVQDDGRGRAGAQEGFGLAGIRARLVELGGELTIEDERGTRLVASAPLCNAKVMLDS